VFPGNKHGETQSGHKRVQSVLKSFGQSRFEACSVKVEVCVIAAIGHWVLSALFGVLRCQVINAEFAFVVFFCLEMATEMIQI
jgi:hypothetical protein